MYIHTNNFSSSINTNLGEELVAATSRNLAELINFVNNLQAGGDTDFTVGKKTNNDNSQSPF